MTEDLKGKKILITGGTSRLGCAFVLNALRRNADISFTYFKADGQAEELMRQGAQGFRLDLSDRQAIAAFADNFCAQNERLDVLIHNAAAVRDLLIRDMTEEDWDHVVEVGLTAPYFLTRSLLPLLTKNRPGKILMLTSRAAYTGSAGAANYAAAKAGLIGLVKSLAKELGGAGVLVNAVNPGFMKSRMTEGLPDGVIERHLKANPLNDYSDPEAVADFLCYLCSDRMTQVTGQVIHWEGRSIY